MPTAYPGATDSLTAGTSSDQLSSPDHADQHDVLNGGLAGVQDKVGHGASMPTNVGDVLTVTGPGDSEWAAPAAATDPELLAIAGLTSAANKLPYFTGSGTAATTDFTAAGRAILDDADAAAQLTTLGAQPVDSDLTAIAALSPSNDDVIQRKAGAWTNRTVAQYLSDLGLASIYQPLDTDLTAIAALTSAADKVPYATGAGTWALADLTATGRALIDDSSTTVQRATLGLTGLAWSTVAGTSFPGSPTTNDRFFRTDRGIEYYYDGTRWLSSTLYFAPIPFSTGTDTYSATTAGAERVAMPWMGVYSIYLVDFMVSFYVNGGTALSGSHKWVATLKDNPAGSVRGTVNIDSGASSVQRASTNAMNAVVATTEFGMFTTYTKTGTPGNISTLAGFTFRLIG